MTLLRMSEIKKMSEKEKTEKMNELKMELIKAGVSANRAKAKTKEIKRAISRLITFNNSDRKGVVERK